MGPFIRYGREVAITAFNSKDYSKFRELLKGASKLDRPDGQAFAAAVMTLRDIVEAAVAGGVLTSRQLPSRAELAFRAAKSGVLFFQDAEQMVLAAKALHAAAPGMKASLRSEDTGKPATPQPMEVKVVAMPSRKSVTTVTRDEDMEIVSTECVVQDLSAE